MTKQNLTRTKSLLELLSNAWTLDILKALQSHGTLRFGAIKEEVAGISGRVLTVRLKRMEEFGFINRFSHPTSPPQVDYTLTEKGNELCQFLDLAERKAEDWVPSY